MAHDIVWGGTQLMTGDFAQFSTLQTLRTSIHTRLHIIEKVRHDTVRSTVRSAMWFADACPAPSWLRFLRIMPPCIPHSILS